MGAAVGLENRIVEVLDAQRDPRHAERLEGPDLRFGERARLALKRHFLGIVPAEALVNPGHEPLELLHAQERGRTAAKVDVAEHSALDSRQRRGERRLAGERQRIPLHVGRRHVGVDTEVAELAPLPAEGHVEIEAKRLGCRRGREGVEHGGHGVGRPPMKRRIVGNEVAARLGGFGHRFLAGRTSPSHTADARV